MGKELEKECKGGGGGGYLKVSREEKACENTVRHFKAEKLKATSVSNWKMYMKDLQVELLVVRKKLYYNWQKGHRYWGKSVMTC